MSIHEIPHISKKTARYSLKKTSYSQHYITVTVLFLSNIWHPLSVTIIIKKKQNKKNPLTINLGELPISCWWLCCHGDRIDCMEIIRIIVHESALTKYRTTAYLNTWKSTMGYGCQQNKFAWQQESSSSWIESSLGSSVKCNQCVNS